MSFSHLPPRQGLHSRQSLSGPQAPLVLWTEAVPGVGINSTSQGCHLVGAH